MTYQTIEKAMSLLRKEGYGIGDKCYDALVAEKTRLERNINADNQKIAKFFDLNGIQHKYTGGEFIYRYNENDDWIYLSSELIEDIGVQAAINEISLQITKQRKRYENSHKTEQA